MDYTNVSPELHIRAATENDYSALEVFAKLLQREHIHLSMTKSKVTMFVEDPDQIMLIAEVQEELVGVISAKKPSSASKTGYWLELFVKSNWRKKGIGKNLLLALVSNCLFNKNIQCLSLSVKRNNKVAVGLYLKHGFKKKFNFISLLSSVIDMELLLSKN